MILKNMIYGVKDV